MLFEPLEEQLDLPAGLIQLRDRERWHLKVIGREFKDFLRRAVAVFDMPEWQRITVRCLVAGETDGSVTEHSSERIDCTPSKRNKAQICSGADDEERALLSKPTQARKIHVAAVHYVESTLLAVEDGRVH